MIFYFKTLGKLMKFLLNKNQITLQKIKTSLHLYRRSRKWRITSGHYGSYILGSSCSTMVRFNPLFDLQISCNDLLLYVKLMGLSWSQFWFYSATRVDEGGFGSNLKSALFRWICLFYSYIPPVASRKIINPQFYFS